MPVFEGKNGKTIEVTQEQAEQVFRIQRQWKEVIPEKEVQPKEIVEEELEEIPKPASKKKTKKKVKKD